MKNHLFLVLCIMSILPTLPLFGTLANAATSSLPGARVFFLTPQDGDVVPHTFTVKFGLEGMRLAKAGEKTPNSGHHHLLIDIDSLVDFSLPLPATNNILHFGGGQTETQLTLPTGKHTLQLLLGDYLHIPHVKPVISQKITILVR
ncbi:DUF4399 domain-containing protein [Grimontia sp. NTOU-MAR1]|uniref:DUF4399 domain-containing protein n=1 Tax=Grimontia sp. NTOU-MAR1 TaxID=3111011 RepID=UPI002DBD5113|nr:DUF4399 domain-containing protein [Grimontia sp. NTOU-MAR1]WRW00531.1 DUF4399 domain-containing protein [Grimontia sp. NTOU-MAR1]